MKTRVTVNPAAFNWEFIARRPVYMLRHKQERVYVSRHKTKIIRDLKYTHKYYGSVNTVTRPGLTTEESELTRQIHIELQSKHNYVYVIYKVLAYTNTLYIT